MSKPATIPAESYSALDQLLGGELPDSLDALQAGAAVLLQVAGKITPVLSLVVADAYRRHFTGNPAGWQAWAAERLQIAGAHLYHLRQGGELMLDVKAVSAKSFWSLFRLENRKLLILAQLDAKDLPAFLSHFDPSALDRSHLEDAVRKFLGLPTKARPAAEQPELPGIECAIGTLAAIEPEMFSGAIKDDSQSRKAAKAGLCVFGAALEYQISRPPTAIDGQLLAAYKAALLNAISEIDATLCRAGDCANGTINDPNED